MDDHPVADADADMRYGRVVEDQVAGLESPRLTRTGVNITGLSVLAGLLLSIGFALDSLGRRRLVVRPTQGRRA